MKKIFALCATVALLSGAAMISTTTVAHAQASGPFADVPTDHWAYTAVDTLQKAGIVIGYPDGTYGGKRALTRYEFATAIARLLPLIKPPDLSPYATNDDLAALRTDLTNRLEQNQAALDALKALVTEFQTELTQLGQDVAAIKTRLTALEERVAVVEAEQRRVKINGDVNIIARSNDVTQGKGLVDEDGYALTNSGGKTFIGADPQVYNDVLLSITGEVSDTTTAVIKIDAGNYLQTIGSSESYDPGSIRYSTFSGAGGFDANGSEQFNIFRAYLDAPVALGALGGGEAQIGRFGEKLTPFTYWAIDPDSYSSTPETDTHEISVDGAKLSFNAGPVAITGFAGKNYPISNASLAAGLNTAALRSGPFLPGSVASQGGTVTAPGQLIDQSAGLRATYGTPDTYTIGITGLIARIQTGTGISPTDPDKNKPYNNLLVYAADYHGYIPGLVKTGITFDGDAAVSSTGYESSYANVNSLKGDEAYKALLGYSFGALTVKAGYEDVYANFVAPGDWGKIGDWTNPTNISGATGSATYSFSPALKLDVAGNYFEGKDNVGALNPLGHSDDVGSGSIKLEDTFNGGYTPFLGYEYVGWRLQDKQGLLNKAGKPTEQYITLGIGHPINKNADVKLAYQIIDYRADGTNFVGDYVGNGIGGVATGQFEFKF